MQISCRAWATFPQIGADGLEDEHQLGGRLGGKGANLHRLHRAGLAVPPGFVVPVDVFRSAVAAGGESHLQHLAGCLEQGDPCTPGELRARYPELVSLLEALRGPLEATLAAAKLSDCWLAVRSSGTLEDGLVASYAGVLESFLGVEAAHLPEAVVLCWASAFTRRCREYSETIGNDPDDMAVAVVVQPVLPAVVSGIVHTRDPLTGEAGMVIEAVRGLNHVACDGHTTPEVLRCRRFGCDRTPADQPWQEVLAVSGIRRIAVSEAERKRPVLTGAQRRELIRLARRVEALLGGPQDIEWTLAQGRIWLLQARPVTAAANSRVWTRANLRELYPEVVTPLTGSLIRGVQQNWYVDYFARMGFDVCHLGPGMRVIRGRPYLNLSLLRCLAESAGVDGAHVEANIGSEAALPAEKAAPNLGRAFKTGLPLLRIVGRYLRAGFSSARTLEQTTRLVAEMELRDPTGLDDAELLAGALRCFRGLQPLYDATADVAGAVEAIDIVTQAVPASTAVRIRESEARGDSREVHAFGELIRLASEERETRLRFLMSNGSGVPCVEAFRGTRFGGALQQYLTEYGFRALYESDSGVPRYAEDPRLLLAAIQANVRAGKTPGPPVAAAEAEAPQSSSGLLHFLARWIRGGRERLLARRQEIRQGTSRLIAAERSWELALARRWQARGWIDHEEDFWQLTLEDIEAALTDPSLGPGWLRYRIERRHARGQEWHAEAMPICWPPPAATAGPAQVVDPSLDPEGLRGIPVSPGVVEGRVKLVLRPEDALGLEPDRILVAPFAGPAWAPFFASARGLVVELGGALSHSSILAREYGLPAVANVPEVTRLLRDGDLIRIDGGKGLVWRLENPAVEVEPAAAPVEPEWRRRRPLRIRATELRPGAEVEWAHQEAA